jgi:membrane protease YdiL (CAAX protease family)
MTRGASAPDSGDPDSSNADSGDVDSSDVDSSEQGHMALPHRVVPVLVAGVVLALVGSLIALSSLGVEDPDESLTGAQEFSLALPWLLALGGAGLVAGGLAGRDPLSSLLLRSPGFSTIVIGVAAGLALQAVVAAVDTWIVDGIFGLDTGSSGSELVEQFVGNERILLVLLVVILGPLAEELLYRGALHGSLAQIWPRSRVVLLVAAIFALSHLSLPQLPGLVIVGVALSVLVAWRQSLWAAIACHVTFNLSGVVLLLS